MSGHTTKLLKHIVHISKLFCIAK